MFKEKNLPFQRASLYRHGSKLINNLKQGFALIDNRHQPIQTLGTDLNGIIQKMDLHPDQLNVAGEDHDESDKRRDQEKLMVKEKLGNDAGYWQEYQFRAIKGSQQPADPEFPRLLQGPAAIIKQVNTMGGSKNEERKQLMETMQDMREGSIIDFANKDSLAHEQVEKIEMLYEVVKDLVESSNQAIGEKLMPMIYQMQTDHLSPKYIEAKKVHLQDLWNDLGLEAKDDLMDLDSDKLSNERSTHMHIAAMHQGGTKGLWKVGEQHVNDIRKQRILPIHTYSLMHKRTFDEIYNQWLAEKS